MKHRKYMETASLGWNAIKASPLRTVLTSLIISFGIMALVGILSATDALKQTLETNFTNLGANTITVRHDAGGFFIDGADRRRNPTISYREAQLFKKRFDLQNSPVSISYPAWGTAKLTFENTSTNPNQMIMAVDENYLKTGGFDLSEGRNFSSDDVFRGSYYAILGAQTKQSLFGDQPASGKIIRINGKPYTVVGILAEKGSSGMFSGDRGAWVPLTTARAAIPSNSQPYVISITAPSAQQLEAVEGRAHAIMRSVRNCPRRSAITSVSCAAIASPKVLSKTSAWSPSRGVYYRHHHLIRSINSLDEHHVGERYRAYSVRLVLEKPLVQLSAKHHSAILNRSAHYNPIGRMDRNPFWDCHR
jgi:putative ABC transport system permease protein